MLRLSQRRSDVPDDFSGQWKHMVKWKEKIKIFSWSHSWFNKGRGEICTHVLTLGKLITCLGFRVSAPRDHPRLSFHVSVPTFPSWDISSTSCNISLPHAVYPTLLSWVCASRSLFYFYQKYPLLTISSRSLTNLHEATLMFFIFPSYVKNIMWEMEVI